MKKLFFCKKGFVAAGVLLMMLFCMPFASSVIMQIGTEGNIYDNIENVPSKDAALVLGAAAYPSRLSDILQDRVDTAIELYKDKKISKIIMSGAPNESEAMAKYAIKNGVDENDVIEDPNGLDTYTSIQNVKNTKSVIIVTQSFHMPRALFIAKHLGIDAVGLTSDKHEYTKIFDFKKREILAASKAMLDLLLQTK